MAEKTAISKEIDDHIRRLAWQCQHDVCAVEGVHGLCPFVTRSSGSVVPDVKPDCKKITEDDWRRVFAEAGFVFEEGN